jgi:SAM-dependent methyltransferase
MTCEFVLGQGLWDIMKINFDDFARDYERLASRQTKMFNSDPDYFARYKVELMKRVATRSPSAVLDFGCGIGRSASHLRLAFSNARIVGCDLSSDSLAIARDNGPHCEFVFPNEIQPGPHFDLILASCAFHHIPRGERHDQLRYCLERLKPGGQVFVFEHNPYNLITRHLVKTCPFDADAILLTRRETARLLARVGFQISSTAYCLFFPQILSALRPLEPALGWLPLGGQYFVAGTRTAS